MLSRRSSLDDANGVFDFDTVLDANCTEPNNAQQEMAIAVFSNYCQNICFEKLLLCRSYSEEFDQSANLAFKLKFCKPIFFNQHR